MHKKSTKRSCNVLARVHEAGRVLAQKRKKLGMSPGEYLKHLTREMRKKGHAT